MEVEIGVTQLQVGKCQQPLEAGRVKEKVLTQSLQKERNLPANRETD